MEPSIDFRSAALSATRSASVAHAIARSVSAEDDAAALFLALARQWLMTFDEPGAAEWVASSDGLEALPFAGVLNRKTVKTTESARPRNCAAEKKIKGRKRHVITYSQGVRVGDFVYTADIQDCDGARGAFRRPLWLCVAAPCLFSRRLCRGELCRALTKIKN
jgi:hypothetical protein